MRYKPEHKQQTRERILAEAMRLLREEWLHGLSVAKVMGSAGLTPGGFYAHFTSQDAMAAGSRTRALPPSGPSTAPSSSA